MADVFEHSLRVRYPEVDAQGVVFGSPTASSGSAFLPRDLPPPYRERRKLRRMSLGQGRAAPDRGRSGG